jgi:autotransporter-associated beta strand protein
MTVNLGSIQGTTPINAVALFNLPANGAITTSFGLAGSVLTNGGAPFATVGTGDWAVKDAANSAIVPGAAVTGFYTPTTPTTLTGNADVSSGVDTTLSGSTAVNTLRFNQAQARTVTVGSGNTLSITGILVTGAVGNNPTVISGGNIQAIGTNLTVFQHNTANSLTIGSAITAGNLVKAGAGTLVLTGTNTTSGKTYIEAGTIQAGATNTLSPNSSIVMQMTAVLTLAGFNQTVAGLTSRVGPTYPTDPVIQNGAATPVTLSVGSTDVTTAWGGTIQNGGTGSLALNKVGVGKFTIGSGYMTYTGGTVITAGTLEPATGLGTGPVTVGTGVFQSNTTPTLIGINNVDAPITVTAFGALVPNGLSVGSFYVSKSVTFQPSSQLAIDIGLTSSSNNLTVTGSSSLLNFQSSGSNGTILKLGTTIGTPFNPNSASSFKIASFTGGATLELNGTPVANGVILGQWVMGGSNVGPIIIDATSLSGIQNGSTFTLSRSGTDVVLAFVPVPEPTFVFGWITGQGIMAAWMFRRRTAR